MPRVESTTVVRALAGPLILLCATLVSTASMAVERLDFQVTYRGVFSLGEDMQIADVTLSTAPGDPAAGLREVGLEASSAAYPLVESLYPIRYRFRSWADLPDGHLVGFESYERTTRQRHRLYLRDDSRRGVRRFDLESGAGAEELAQLAAGVRPAVVASGAPLFDRLGLLAWLRAQDLVSGAEYRLEVTDGHDRLGYQVRVEGAQTLRLGAVAVAALKLRLDATERRADGRDRTAHPPVYLWVSRSAGHLPLRIDSRHAIGLFRLELDADSPALRTVLATR